MAAAEAVEYFKAISAEIQDPTAVTPEYEGKDDLAFYLSRVPFGTPRQLKVIIVGCGLSGLSFAHELNAGTVLKNVDLTIYEKDAGVGGTWYENRYPGCACDIPVHNYQFAWAPYPHFNTYYASSDEIHHYIEDVADQHDLRKYIKVCHKVKGAQWDEIRSKWIVSVQRTDGRDLATSGTGEDAAEDAAADPPFTDECDVFINATGYVNDWKWPAIQGREKFAGRMLHSAAWPKEHQSFAGETVALIGNGSSGIQILPAILDQAEKIYVFIRSPTWVTAGFAQKYAGPGGSNVTFSEEQKQRWEDNPDEYFEYRKNVEAELNKSFRIYLKDSAEQEAAKRFATKQMSEKLASKPELLKLLLPDFAVGCRRPTPGNGYLEALCSEKVEVVWGEIDSFTEKTMRSASGREVAIDSVICATGFNVAFAPRFPVIGRNNVDLQVKWKQNPQAYLSVTTNDMPNYFVYLGPASAIGHGSIISSIELISGYIADLINKLQTENYASLCPKAEVVEAWQRHSFAWLEKTAWSTPCVSTYKNGTRDGKLVSLHPGSRLHYFELLRKQRYEDFDWKSLCDNPDLKFAWLASGFTQGEVRRQTAKTEKEDAELLMALTWFLPRAEKRDFIKKRPTTTKAHVNGKNSSLD